METRSQQSENAVNDMAEATRQFLEGMRPMIQDKYELSDGLLGIAAMKAMATVAIECVTSVALNSCE